MNRVAAFFVALMILTLPLAAYAKPTLLAREEATVKVNADQGTVDADQGAVIDDLIKKVIKKME